MEDPFQFLILACDGLWDVVSDEEAVDIVIKAKNPEDAAVKLRNRALHSNSKDNISVLVIDFPQFRRKMDSPRELPKLPEIPVISTRVRPKKIKDAKGTNMTKDNLDEKKKRKEKEK